MPEIPVIDEEKHPVLFNHERRITQLETLMNNVSTDLKELKSEVKRGNDDQSKRLDEINNRLFEEFFEKKSVNRKEAWKIAGYMLGGGGILYLAIDRILSIWL